MERIKPKGYHQNTIMLKKPRPIDVLRYRELWGMLSKGMDIVIPLEATNPAREAFLKTLPSRSILVPSNSNGTISKEGRSDTIEVWEFPWPIPSLRQRTVTDGSG